MKALAWYSTVIVALSHIVLIDELLSYGYDSEAFWGIALYAPVMVFLLKHLRSYYK